MNFQTKTGTCFVAIGTFTKKKGDKSKFFRFLNESGFVGDMNQAWKNYIDAK